MGRSCRRLKFVSSPVFPFLINLEIGLNPDPLKLPNLDPKDEFLLADPSSSTGVYSVNGSHPGSINSHPTPLTHVPWLRKTEYISREGVQKTGVQEP